MRGSCSNVVLRSEFICNTFGIVLLYVVIKGILFEVFLSTLVLVMGLSQFLIIVEILYLEIFP